MRVSLPISTAGRPAGRRGSAANVRPAAQPSFITSSGVIGASPTRPRTPSVPKYSRFIPVRSPLRQARLCARRSSAPLEELDLALVLLGRCARLERAEVAALAGLRVDLARIEAVPARRELADHGFTFVAMSPA